MVHITAITYFSNNVIIHRQIPLARALILMDHVGAIIPPEAGLFEVRSPSRVFLVPDQIVLNVNRAFVPQVPQPTRRGVYARDRGVCAYCGHWVPFSGASLDHVIPISQGGQSRWENLVNACLKCNQRKAARTPDQAHMPLVFRPKIPKVRLRLDLLFA